MNADPGRGTVIVVAHESMLAARLEHALHDLAGWGIRVVTPRRLRDLVEEHPNAVVVTALTANETRRVLRATAGWPRSPVIIAVCDAPGGLWTSAFRAAGLRAALPACTTADELTAAVRAVQAGLWVLHPTSLAPSRAGDTAVAAGAPLTSREREILEMMADGAHNRTIATRLGISRHTVKFHVTSILTKLGAESRTEAVALALRRGLLAV
jgi:DNA-binding NarL/FixJ family response regulator